MFYISQYFPRLSQQKKNNHIPLFFPNTFLWLLLHSKTIIFLYFSQFSPDYPTTRSQHYQWLSHHTKSTLSMTIPPHEVNTINDYPTTRSQHYQWLSHHTKSTLSMTIPPHEVNTINDYPTTRSQHYQWLSHHTKSTLSMTIPPHEVNTINDYPTTQSQHYQWLSHHTKSTLSMTIPPHKVNTINDYPTTQSQHYQWLSQHTDVYANHLCTVCCHFWAFLPFDKSAIKPCLLNMSLKMILMQGYKIDTNKHI